MIKEYKGMIKFGLVFVVIGYLLRLDLGNGILLGFSLGMFHYITMSLMFGMMLSQRKFNPGLFLLYFIGNIGVFAAPFYIGCVYPDVVNVFGAAFGLAIRIIYVYVSAIVEQIAAVLQRIKERRDEIRQI